MSNKPPCFHLFDKGGGGAPCLIMRAPAVHLEATSDPAFHSPSCSCATKLFQTLKQNSQGDVTGNGIFQSLRCMTHLSFWIQVGILRSTGVVCNANYKRLWLMTWLQRSVFLPSWLWTGGSQQKEPCNTAANFVLLCASQDGAQAV